ncbi:MAG: hypothetical protein IT458_16480 [Planctomycetes bacterium]|nr:hypothetical protein [Planctomycetota bacterium]
MSPHLLLPAARSSRNLLPAVLAAVCAVASVSAQTLVRDFSPPVVTQPSSNPGLAVILGGIAYFTANDVLGTELWRSDGSLGGTYRVKDLNPGAASSDPDELIVAGGLLFFSAAIGGHGRELCASDGTAAGTRIVRDLRVGSDVGAQPRHLAVFQGRVWFAADDGVAGEELFVSDGTTAGTVRVLDLAPGGAGSAPQDLIAWNGRLWFTAQDARGRELWSSDGTAAGTQLLVDFLPGAASFAPQELTPAGPQLFFSAAESGAGRELYATDGTATGTRRVADLQPGATGSFPRWFVGLGASVVFEANDGVHGGEPWCSDGTPAGTFLLRDVNPGAPTSQSTEYTRGAGGGRVFFAAANASGRSLWVTDGTVAGTLQVLPGLIQVGNLGTGLGGIACAAQTASSGATLWVSDGTAAGTRAVPGAPRPSFVSAYGNRVLFRGGDNSTGQELYVSDGNGAALVRDLTPAIGSTEFGNFTDARGSLFFSPNFATGWVPWISNGTLPGTLELNPGLGNPRSALWWNGGVWFVASTPTTSFELCRSDGTGSGTNLVLDLFPGTQTSSPADLTPTTGPLFFTAAVAAGRELWSTDGTLAGTRAFDLQPGTGSSRPAYLTAFGNRCVLAADDGSSGAEPWISDGTPAGTLRLGDLMPGGGASSPAEFTVSGPRVFFTATLPGVGRELCVSDGTPAGTGLFADLLPGAGSSSPDMLVACGPLLFFRAAVPGLGSELFVSDGTVAGTRMVLELGPGALSAQIGATAGMHGRLLFTLDDQVHGRELWVSDGTAPGTRMVLDLLPGAGHGVVRDALVRVPGSDIVVFAGADGVDGLQLWTSDASAAGTRRLGRMGGGAGSGASVLAQLQPVGDRLFFVAGVEGAGGEELWVVPLAPPNAAFTRTYGDARCPGSLGIAPRILAVGQPRLGNAGFAVDLVAARASSLAVLQVGAAPAEIGLAGCTLLVAPPWVVLPPVPTDVRGRARTPLGIPADPSLVGIVFHGQYAVLDPGGSLLGGLALSDGIEVRVGG